MDLTRFLNKKVAVTASFDGNHLLFYQGILLSFDGSHINLDDRKIGQTVIGVSSIRHIREAV